MGIDSGRMIERSVQFNATHLLVCRYLESHVHCASAEGTRSAAKFGLHSAKRILQKPLHLLRPRLTRYGSDSCWFRQGLLRLGVSSVRSSHPIHHLLPPPVLFAPFRLFAIFRSPSSFLFSSPAPRRVEPCQTPHVRWHQRAREHWDCHIVG